MRTVQEQKKALRKEVLRQRNEITQRDLKNWNELLKEHLLNSTMVQKAAGIHCFISMKDKIEVDTWHIITELIHKKKNIIVPVVQPGLQLVHSKIGSLDSLTTNSWGVFEPEEICEVDVRAIDLVLVPLLAIDERGNRLGYGKGFYDRFLATVSVPKIGLCFDKFVFKQLPAEEHDVKLNGIITEKGVRLL